VILRKKVGRTLKRENAVKQMCSERSAFD